MQLLQRKMQEADQQEASEQHSYNEEEYSIIESYMRDNGYSDEDITIVLDSFAAGNLSFEDFKMSTGTTDEYLEKYKTTNDDKQDEETSENEENTNDLNE